MDGWMDDEEELEAKKEPQAYAWASYYYPSAFFPFYRNGPQTQGTETEPHPLPSLGPGPPSSL